MEKSFPKPAAFRYHLGLAQWPAKIGTRGTGYRSKLLGAIGPLWAQSKPRAAFRSTQKPIPVDGFGKGTEMVVPTDHSDDFGSEKQPILAIKIVQLIFLNHQLSPFSQTLN